MTDTVKALQDEVRRLSTALDQCKMDYNLQTQNKRELFAKFTAKVKTLQEELRGSQ